MPTRTIGLPNGRSVTLGEYVRSWKHLLTLPPNREVAGWNWYPVTAADILRQIRRGVFDRLHRRGHVRTDWPDPQYARLRRKLDRLIVECRWCGTAMPYQPHHARFCCQSCRQDYNS